MKFKKYLSMPFMIALLMAASPVFADEAIEDAGNAPDVEISETKFDEDDFESSSFDIKRIEGNVIDLEKEQDQMSVETRDGDEFSVDTQNAIFIKGRRISAIDSVMTGDEVIVEAIETDGYHQLKARGILIQNEGSFLTFHIDRFDFVEDGLVSSDFSIRIPDQEDLVVIDEDGEEIEILMENLHGKQLAVIYGAATFSIPAIPLQPTIIVLEEQARDIVPMPLPVVDPLIPIAPELPQKEVINMLDLLPFWARGGHVSRPQIDIEIPIEGTDEETSDVVEDVIEDLEDIIDENYFIGIEVIVDEHEVIVEAGSK